MLLRRELNDIARLILHFRETVWGSVETENVPKKKKIVWGGVTVKLILEAKNKGSYFCYRDFDISRRLKERKRSLINVIKALGRKSIKLVAEKIPKKNKDRSLNSIAWT